MKEQSSQLMIAMRYILYPPQKNPKNKKKTQEISSSGISSTFEEDNYFNVPKYNTADVFSSKDY